MQICVLIITPIPALRAGLRALASGEADIKVVGSAPSLRLLSEFPSPEGVLVTTSGALGADDLERLAAQDGWALLMIGDDPQDALAAARALPQGRAWGLLASETGPEGLQAALIALTEGISLLSAAMMANLVERFPINDGGAGEGPDEDAPENLTEREVDVLRHAARGLTNKQIALALGISEHTVKFHISAIYAKLKVSNRAEAVSKGARWGWVPL